MTCHARWCGLSVEPRSSNGCLVYERKSKQSSVINQSKTIFLSRCVCICAILLTLACVAIVSVGLGSKERRRNGILPPPPLFSRRNSLSLNPTERLLRRICWPVIYFHLTLITVNWLLGSASPYVFQSASTLILLSIFSVIIIRQERVQIKIAVVVISVATAKAWFFIST